MDNTQKFIDAVSSLVDFELQAELQDRIESIMEGKVIVEAGKINGLSKYDPELLQEAYSDTHAAMVKYDVGEYYLADDVDKMLSTIEDES